MRGVKAGGGGGLTYESDVRVPPSTSDVGVFQGDKLHQKTSLV